MPHYDKYAGYMWDGDLLGKPCFHCGEPLAAPMAVWHGSALDDNQDGRLALHASCVVALSAGLMRDAQEIFEKSCQLIEDHDSYQRIALVARDNTRLAKFVGEIGVLLGKARAVTAPLPPRPPGPVLVTAKRKLDG